MSLTTVCRQDRWDNSAKRRNTCSALCGELQTSHFDSVAVNRTATSRYGSHLDTLPGQAEKNATSCPPDNRGGGGCKFRISAFSISPFGSTSDQPVVRDVEKVPGGAQPCIHKVSRLHTKPYGYGGVGEGLRWPKPLELRELRKYWVVSDRVQIEPSESTCDWREPLRMWRLMTITK